MTETPHLAELRFRFIADTVVSACLLFGLELIEKADGEILQGINYVLCGGLQAV